MKIAIPVVEGQLCMHFGHCDEFALIDVDADAKKITGKSSVAAPPHQPGLLPRWLAERGANLIIAGGMGGRAQGLFQEQGISVITGAPSGDPEAIVMDYLRGSLVTGVNTCDH
jgi:predicted Fe-Mo cluster-binding NifX family protein